MAGRKPKNVVLNRDGEQPQTIHVSDYHPPLRGVIWDTSHLEGLTGSYGTVDGGVTSVRLEYGGGDSMSFDVAGCAEPVAGVVWAEETKRVVKLGNELLDPNQPQWASLVDIKRKKPGAAAPDGCYIINGKVWCPS